MKFEFLQYVKIIMYEIIKQDSEESTVKLCKSPSVITSRRVDGSIKSNIGGYLVIIYLKILAMWYRGYSY